MLGFCDAGSTAILKRTFFHGEAEAKTRSEWVQERVRRKEAAQ